MSPRRSRLVTPPRLVVNLRVTPNYSLGGTLSEHVLVVEPAREERAQLQRYLETEGYRVSTADAAEAALRAFELIPADAVLVSFEGLATCRRLRQLPAGAHTAILCL